MRLLIVILVIACLQLSWAQQDVTITNPLEGAPGSTLLIACAVYTRTGGQRQINPDLRNLIALRTGDAVFDRNRTTDRTNATHKIYELNLMASDIGTSVTCAINTISSPSVTIQVLITPNVTRDSSDNVIVTPDTLSLSIQFSVSGNPPPMITVERADSSAAPSSITTSENAVIVTRPGLNDGGTYRFTVTNRLGMDSIQFNIIVQFAPIFSDVLSSESIVCTPLDSGSLNMCAIRSGASGSLDCTFQSNPAGNVTYTTPQNSNSVLSEDGIISISSAATSAAGMYTCSAQNEVLQMTRTTTKTFILYVGEPPVPVEINNAPVVNDESVVISWTYPGNNEIPTSINISIESRPPAQPQVITDILPVTQTSFAVPLSELQPSESYRVTIRAENLLDSGQGRDTTFITPEMSSVPTSTPGRTRQPTAAGTTVTSLSSLALLLLCIAALQ